MKLRSGPATAPVAPTKKPPTETPEDAAIQMLRAAAGPPSFKTLHFPVTVQEALVPFISSVKTFKEEFHATEGYAVIPDVSGAKGRPGFKPRLGRWEVPFHANLVLCAIAARCQENSHGDVEGLLDTLAELLQLPRGHPYLYMMSGSLLSDKLLLRGSLSGVYRAYHQIYAGQMYDALGPACLAVAQHYLDHSAHYNITDIASAQLQRFVGRYANSSDGSDSSDSDRLAEWTVLPRVLEEGEEWWPWIQDVPEGFSMLISLPYTPSLYTAPPGAVYEEPVIFLGALKVVLQHLGLPPSQQQQQLLLLQQRRQQEEELARIQLEMQLLQVDWSEPLPAWWYHHAPGPLSRAVLSSLHLVNKACLSAARASLIRADLRQHAKPWQSFQLQDMAPDDPQLLPWDFLAAAPAVRAVILTGHQVPVLEAGPQEVVGGRTGRLRALRVENLQHQPPDGRVEAQMQGLGRLLAGCSRLQYLSIMGAPDDRSVRLDQRIRWKPRTEQCQLILTAFRAGLNSSSSSSSSSSLHTSDLGGGIPSGPRLGSKGAVGAQAAASPPPAAEMAAASRQQGAVGLPLQQLMVRDLPLAPFGAWLQQRGQLGKLRSLDLYCSQRDDFDHSWEWLIALRGLQELRLRGSSGGFQLPGMLADLSSSLTQLSVAGFRSATPNLVVQQLTQLRQLELEPQRDYTQLDCSWLTALKQLTHLRINGWVGQLPPDLGQALPQLEELLVGDCALTALPTGLKRLTRLDASRNVGLAGAGLAAVSHATALRWLNLSHCNLLQLACLSSLSQLEVLLLHGQFERPNAARRGPPALALPCLPNLRRLDLQDSSWRVSDLTALGSLQRLTFLDLSSGVRWHGKLRKMPGPVLPALRELNLASVPVRGHQWQGVGAWLGQQSQLTRLSLAYSELETRNVLADGEQLAAGLAQLPTQLVELDLRDCGMWRFPARLSKMTNLKVLLAGGNYALCSYNLPGVVNFQRHGPSLSWSEET